MTLTEAETDIRGLVNASQSLVVELSLSVS